MLYINNFSIFVTATVVLLSTYKSVIETSRSVKFSQNLCGLWEGAATLTSWIICLLSEKSILQNGVGTVAYLRPRAMREA